MWTRGVLGPGHGPRGRKRAVCENHRPRVVVVVVVVVVAVVLSH